DGEPVTNEQADLHDREQRQHDDREQQRELDGGLARAPVVAAPAHGMIFSTTESKSRPTAWLLVAHVTRSVATAAAPRMTSAYSAVVCPSSAGVTRFDTNM